MDHTEDGRVRADADGNRGEGHGGEAAPLDEDANGETQIVEQHRIDSSSSARSGGTDETLDERGPHSHAKRDPAPRRPRRARVLGLQIVKRRQEAALPYAV